MENMRKDGSLWIWYFCLSVLESSPVISRPSNMSPLKSGMCIALMLITILSQLAVPPPHFLVLRWEGIPASPCSSKHTHMSNHKRCHRAARSSAAGVNGRPSFRLYQALMKVGMDVRGGSEEMPWSAKPALNYGPGSAASGAWNRQVPLAGDARGQLLQTSRWMDDADAGSSALTQTCALHFIGWHYSDRDSSRRLECRGSQSQASTKMRQTASC